MDDNVTSLAGLRSDPMKLAPPPVHVHSDKNEFINCTPFYSYKYTFYSSTLYIECLTVFCMLKANTGLVCLLCYVSNINIFQYVTHNQSCTRHNTLHFIIPELIPMYTLESEVHACINASFIGHLSSKPG